MTHVKLTKAGGFIGLIRSAETETSIEKNELIVALNHAVKEKNAWARDEETYTVYVNDAEFKIDPQKLRGPVKKLIDDLEGKLRPVKI